MTHEQGGTGGDGKGSSYDPVPGLVIVAGIEDMHATSIVENQFLSERVKGQIFDFVGLLERYNSKLPSERQRSPEDYAFLRHFYPAFVADRNSRASEVRSPEYEAAVDEGVNNLPMTTMAVMCMDGRVKMIHVFGFSAEIGSAIRVPGGLPKGFVRGKDGRLVLDPESSFAQQLDIALNKNRRLAEVFDSHWACKARKEEEASRGKSPQDGGLYSDVLHKKEMAAAIQEYVLETHEDTRQLALIQTTFNPITGYLYMGLETDEALAFAKDYAQRKANGNGKHADKALPVYSKEVIKAMIDEGIVISTGQLIDNDVVRRSFDENFFTVSWRDDYVNSAMNLWEGISAMRDTILPIFKRNLIALYPGLSSTDKNTQRELEERAMLLLCNAFNAYLHNRDHNEADYLQMEDEKYEEQEHYEYDEHREEGVKISRGGHPVYHIPMLVVDSEDKKNMPGATEFGGEIVRGNRLKKSVVDGSGTYTEPEEFAQAPVPCVMQEIVTDERLTADDWKALEDIDWSDLKDLEWDKKTSSQFAKYLEKKGKLVNSLANALERLRQNMITVFDRDADTAAHLIDQYKVILPVVCDQDRETHAVVPFIKLGY